MSAGRQRFTPPQRLLHWLMAVCILAMLFIGVGMAATVSPRYGLPWQHSSVRHLLKTYSEG